MFLPSDLREFQTELAGRLVLMEEPGKEMQSLRERYGFKQEWFANLLGIRRESLSRIETGAIRPTVEMIQRFTRIVTLARGVREHIAYQEARDNRIDEGLLHGLVVSLRLEKEAAEEIILASQMNYEAKRRETLRGISKR
ncbi:MAG: helix-turn-helix domain-containing protein [Thermoplasmatota archaeon]